MPKGAPFRKRRMNIMKSYKPGEKATEAGSYDLVNQNGTKTGFTVRVKANDSFPPSDKDGQHYVKSK